MRSQCVKRSVRTAPPLTVQAQNGRRKRRRVGKGEFDGVLFGPLEQLGALSALLLLPSLLLAFLLFSRQRFFGLLLLNAAVRQTRKVIQSE